MSSSGAPPASELAEPYPAGPSSRLRKIPLFFAEHKRDQVQAFAYDEDTHQIAPFKTPDAFIKFLGVPQNLLQSQPPRSAAHSPFTFDNFVGAANSVATSIKDRHFATGPLLVFKPTQHKIPLGHVTDTKCRPDYTAAFDKHWGKAGVTFWPCIRFAGEKASSGTPKEDRGKQAISYLHYLLLARPDLHVAQGLLTTEASITFLLGIGGRGVCSLKIPWGKDVYKVAYAFIYRLYDPGDFADQAYKLMDSRVIQYLKLDSNQTRDVVVPYDVDLEVTGTTHPVVCSDFVPIYASNPFETRTHVLSNPSSKLKIHGKYLTVLKDQLCHLGTRFNEHTILDAVHGVPGVVEMVYQRKIESPFNSDERKKHLTGLKQSGRPFLAIETLQQMLETAFDVLEVLRFLRYNRQVLHRDISEGNVMYVEEATEKTSSNTSAVDAMPVGVGINVTEEVTPCFIKYLLRESDDPQKTSVLLIDFNHAELLTSKGDPEYKRAGTPLFMARAVERGAAVPLPNDGHVPRVPRSPACYASKHPDRIKKFPLEEAKFGVEASADSVNRECRQELDHDAESVFWLIFFWSMSVQPVDEPKEGIEATTWAGVTGKAISRTLIVKGAEPSLATHSFYEPLWPLLQALTEILRIDRYWLDKSETRNDPEYVNEAFQRLILQFVLDNNGKEFMKRKVEKSFRKVKEIAQEQTQPCTSGQSWDVENRKRSSSCASMQQAKRLCLGTNSTSNKGSRGSGRLGNG